MSAYINTMNSSDNLFVCIVRVREKPNRDFYVYIYRRGNLTQADKKKCVTKKLSSIRIKEAKIICTFSDL